MQAFSLNFFFNTFIMEQSEDIQLSGIGTRVSDSDK